MAYRITIDPAAVRVLKKLDPKTRQAVASAINALADDPRPDGVRKLSGSKDGYRLRTRDYGILYRIADQELLVLVVKVGHRRDVYR